MSQPLLYQIGVTLAGRFELLEVIGHGGVGVVYRARDRELGQQEVAVKVLYPHLLNQQSVVDRFKNEVRIARELSHPHIVRIFEWGTDGKDRHFIVMEYVRGVALRDLLDGQPGGKLPVAEAIRILYEVADAMTYAHSKKIIHRDLKPDNIIIDTDGHARVLDFGLARIVEDDRGMTRTGESLGTAYYMSPEQFRGLSVDDGADIYAFGITAYEILSGRRPFDSEVFYNLAQAHLNEELPPFPEQTTIPSWLDESIRKATKKLREERFESMEEVSALLAAHIASGVLRSHEELMRNFRASEYRRRLRERRRGVRRGLRQLTAYLLLIATVYVVICHFNTRQWGYLTTEILRAEKYTGSTIMAPIRFIVGAPISYHHPNAALYAWQQLEEYTNNYQYDKLQRWSTFLASLAAAGADFSMAVPGQSLRLADFLLTQGPSKSVLRLADQGYDLNTVDAEGTPLLFTAIGQYNEVHVEEIVKHPGFDPNRTDRHGRTAMHVAVIMASPSMVSSILSAARPPNLYAQDEEGRTPLLQAIGIRSAAATPILRTLFSSSTVDINGPLPDGRRPLFAAIEGGTPTTVRELVLLGADINRPGLRGESALSAAELRNDPDILAIVEEALRGHGR